MMNTFRTAGRTIADIYVYDQYTEVVYIHTYAEAIDRPTILHMCMYDIVYGECAAIFLSSKATFSLKVYQSYMGLSINA